MKNVIVTIKYLGDEKLQWTRSDIDDVFYSNNAFFFMVELIQISATNTIQLKRVSGEV